MGNGLPGAPGKGCPLASSLHILELFDQLA